MSGIRELLSDRPVAYYPTLARAVSSVAGAIFIQQISHWQGGKDRWVYRTQEELEGETALSPKAQAGARGHLVRLGVLEEEHKGLPRRLYYRVKWENLEALLQSCQRETLDQPDGQVCTSPSVDTTVESSNESKEPSSPKGADAPEREEKDLAQTSSAAKDMTTLTVDRCRERGLDASPGQKTNWGTGWAKYLYVPEGQDPPTPEEAYDVLDEIVASAAGKRGKTGYWISVQNAAKRLIEGNVTDLPVKKDKIRYDSDGRKWVNGMMEA